MTVVLSVAPHPDDEVIGAGPVSLVVQDAGHRIHVVCASLGRPPQHARRAAEAAAAAEAAGWTLHLPARPAAISAGDDLPAAEAELGPALSALVDEVGADVVVGPGPHDAHHGHEVVARALRDALVTRPGLRWWAWATWGHLPVANLAVPFPPAVLDRALVVLEAYAGELARTDYRGAVVGAARLGGALAGERVFGFGTSRGWHAPLANVLCESVALDGRWVHTVPRVLDPVHPLAGEPDPGRSSAWLHQPSPYGGWPPPRGVAGTRHRP